jgi:hypothetical protein
VIKKVLPHLAADEQFISRFVDEAQVAIKLQHVNVAQVFEVGRVGDEYFLALEYVEGRDLRRTLAVLGHRRQRFPVDLALFIGRELANGLAYAHRRTTADGTAMNLVHCDISPPNVLVSFEGETKVIDFGIAKSVMRGTATDPKMGFGKFGYMAPEQLIRGGVVDHRTDIYAAGVVLYELLTGQRLYESGPDPDYRALARKVARGEHALPSDTDPALAPYDQLVATALRPKPEERYQSAAEFRDAIQHALVHVNPTISTDQLGAFMRELFADEMAAQRELHERVASAHLEDFQEQFHTQTISTVSFAMAELPVELASPVPARTRPRASGPVRALPTVEVSPDVAIPSGAYAEHGGELATELADGTGTIVREMPPVRRRRRFYVIGALLAIAFGGLAAFAVLHLTGKRTAATKSSADPQISFEPIADPGSGGTGSTASDGSDEEPEIEIDPTEDPAPTPSVKPRRTVRRTDTASTQPAQPATAKAPSKEPEREGLTRAAVAAKFSQASREYESYKAKNGMRLDRDWNELTTFIQFKMTNDNLEDAMRRIESFRGKLRE